MEKDEIFALMCQDFPDLSEEYLKKIAGYPQKVSALYMKVGIEKLLNIDLPNADAFLQKGSTAHRIGINEEISKIKPGNDTDFRLHEMYRLTGARVIQPLYLINDRVMIVDEEGALKDDRRINWIASWLFAEAALRGEISFSPYFIYGNVLLINDNQFK